MLEFKECLNNKDEGHLKTIVSIDYIEYKGHVLWLTGGEDYAIKLWKGVRK